MQIAYIKFNNRADQIRGFYALATKAQVTSLPGGIYAVPWKALALLDEENIAYRRATDAEVPLKHGAIRACPFTIMMAARLSKRSSCEPTRNWWRSLVLPARMPDW
jgi:hypothetical protein